MHTEILCKHKTTITHVKVTIATMLQAKLSESLEVVSRFSLDMGMKCRRTLPKREARGTRWKVVLFIAKRVGKHQAKGRP